MEMVQQLTEIYEQYVRDVEAVRAKAKPVDGLFGMGDDPRKDPCHMAFYDRVEQWTKTFLASDSEQAEVFAAAKILLQTPATHKGQECFWFLYAAQGFAREMIPRLSAEQCRELRSFYDEAYPKRDRMPVQKEVYKLLKKGAARA